LALLPGLDLQHESALRAVVLLLTFNDRNWRLRIRGKPMNFCKLSKACPPSQERIFMRVFVAASYHPGRKPVPFFSKDSDSANSDISLQLCTLAYKSPFCLSHVFNGLTESKRQPR
jgi:hypothetical protein